MKTSCDNDDCIEITGIDPRSSSKLFGGVVSGIAAVLSLCYLLAHTVLIQGNMVFLPRESAAFLGIFTPGTVLLLLCATVLCGFVCGYLGAVIFNAVARTGGIRIRTGRKDRQVR